MFSLLNILNREINLMSLKPILLFIHNFSVLNRKSFNTAVNSKASQRLYTVKYF